MFKTRYAPADGNWRNNYHDTRNAAMQEAYTLANNYLLVEVWDTETNCLLWSTIED